MARHIDGVCPSCKSTNLVRPGTNYRCQSCDYRFREPQSAIAYERQHRGKSGVIAPLSYRQQLAREILENNEASRARIDQKRRGRYYQGMQS